MAKRTSPASGRSQTARTDLTGDAARRAADGKQLRAIVPLESHGHFEPTDARMDPIAILEQQAVSRVPELVPLRYGRMVASPFAFYRGAAAIMAADLAAQPSTGLGVQLCGDAHLSNFGFYASPERRLVFDLNDFDETLPGPFEWDVKRLAASLEVAARSQSFRRNEARGVVLACVHSYREGIRAFATMSNQAVWYARLDAEEFLAEHRALVPAERLVNLERLVAVAKTKDSAQAFSKLTHVVDGQPRIISNPPVIVPVEELFQGPAVDHLLTEMSALLGAYRTSLVSDRQHLLDQYRFVHMARKVVGVGSVGTRAWVLLFEGIHVGDPLLLQAKEAQASVLEPHLAASEYGNHGERVVAGQRLMQATSDIFLGWQRTNGLDGVDRDYYVRQLRDWKASVEVEGSTPAGMTRYAEVCGWTLARAHARSGDRVAIAAYLGKSDRFDQAIADYAAAYADQNDKDHSALRTAIDGGRVQATVGV